jgi:hypothetical protein
MVFVLVLSDDVVVFSFLFFSLMIFQNRLTIGLAWQQLFFAGVAAIVPKDREDSVGLVVTAKVLAALLVFAVGCQLEKFIKNYKTRKPSDGQDDNKGEYSMLQNILDTEEHFEEPLL